MTNKLCTLDVKDKERLNLGVYNHVPVSRDVLIKEI